MTARQRLLHADRARAAFAAAVATLATAAAVASAPACAKTAEDLAPFPCAADGTCPSGLLCLKGTCRAASASGGACTDGCNEGFQCSYPPGAERLPGATCVVDCATDPCPVGLVCATLYAGKKGCVAQASVDSEDRPCTTPTDCTPPIPYTCSLGVCAKTCAVGGGACDPGRVCNTADPVVYSGCLRDCTTSPSVTSCPTGLSCKDLASAPGKRACVSPTADGGG